MHMPDLSDEQNTELLSGMDAALEAAAAGTTPNPMLDDDETPNFHEVPAEPLETPPADPPKDPPVDPPKDPAADATPPADPQSTPPADPNEPPADPAATPPVEPDAEAVAAADASLAGEMKGKAKERFEHLSTQVKTYRETLEQAGIKDIAELPAIVTRANNGDQMIEMVMGTGATAEQYGGALEYLATVNRAMREQDPVAAKAALEMLLPAVRDLSALAGVDATVADPLDAFEDLKTEVDNGDMSRARALELASVRTRDALAATARKERETAAASVVTEDAAIEQLVAFDKEMRVSDATYLAKRPKLHEMVVEIRKTLPPEKWEEATKRAYASIAAPAPKPPAATTPPAPPRQVRMGPVRNSGAVPNMVKSFDNPMDALNFALGVGEGN